MTKITNEIRMSANMSKTLLNDFDYTIRRVTQHMVPKTKIATNIIVTLNERYIIVKSKINAGILMYDI